MSDLKDASMLSKMKIAVVGTGYVGLVAGTCFAEMGNTVVCVDVDEAKVDAMRLGKVPIYEPGLEEMFNKNIDKNRLSFSLDLAESIKGAAVVLLALPTPPAEDGSADLGYVLGVADDLGKLIDEYTVVVNKSTVPIGTAALVTEAIGKNVAAEFDVVSNPEFLREGLAVQDFMNPTRIVIGTGSSRAEKVMRELYEPLTEAGSRLYVMDEESSEMTKYAANAFLATKISFMNEIANLCELVGADVDSVRQGMGSDDRISNKFLNAGIGYGGSCFPKDVSALHKIGLKNDYDFKILEAVEAVNILQKTKINRLVEAKFDDEGIRGKKFAIWGLAFKAETDDIREAPALEIIKGLLAAGAEVCAYDPEAAENVKQLMNGVDNLVFADDKFQALEEADGLIIATEWSEFMEPDFSRMSKLMNRPIIFDGRNIFDATKVRAQGFEYVGIGRKN